MSSPFTLETRRWRRGGERENKKPKTSQQNRKMFAIETEKIHLNSLWTVPWDYGSNFARRLEVL